MGAANQHRGVADAADADALGVRRPRMLSHRFNFQAESGLFQHEPSDRHQQKRQVYQNVVGEEDWADHRQVRQHRDVDGGEALDLSGQRPDAEHHPVNVGRKSCRQDIQANGRNHLVGPDSDTEPGHNQAEEDP